MRSVKQDNNSYKNLENIIYPLGKYKFLLPNYISLIFFRPNFDQAKLSIDLILIS
jgi:hypothetical protein